MKITERSTINDLLDLGGHNVKLIVEHDKRDKHPFGITIGCIDEWLSEKDLQTIVKIAKKALAIRKAAIK